MKVEIFYSPGCAACVDAYGKLRAAAQEAVRNLDWREVSVLDHLDRAVELGVMTLPSIVVDRELVFTSIPTVKQLRDALIARNRGRT
jgi:thioredoxin 1